MKDAFKVPEYRLLDSGLGRRLEQVGSVRIIRPALNAFWKPTLPESEWKKADGVFKRETSGGGSWSWFNGKRLSPDEDFFVSWGGVILKIKPTNFGHLGFFAEQAGNWAWLREAVKKISDGKTAPKTLNLFAYSGGASIAMAQGGAEVCHLDASKGIIEWAKHNKEANHLPDKSLRWICDDAMKFLAREKRRASKYNGIVLDPPSFGRGTQGQVWKIEDDIASLLDSCRAIINTTEPFFILLTGHSQGFSPVSLGRCLKEIFPEFADDAEWGEMVIPEYNSSSVLPAGIFARICTGKR